MHPASGATGSGIRPFRIHVPEETLVDLRRRLAATRWPEKETVADDTQGVQLATVQKLVQPLAEQITTGARSRRGSTPSRSSSPRSTALDIHFIHVRSRHANALPLIVTHGWPGSVIEQLKIVDRLANPTAHGAKRSGCL